MKLALTGGIACGKSLLSVFLNELGVETLDADDVVHEILPDPEERRRIAAEVFADPEKRRALEAKIHPLVKERIDQWLGEVLSPAASAFAASHPSSDRLRGALSSGDMLVLSRGKAALVQGVGKHQAPGTRSAQPTAGTSAAGAQAPAAGESTCAAGAQAPTIRIAIIPLLFEAHWEKNFDIICCVASSRERQIERMTATRGMTRAEAEARLAAQLSVEEKARRSHYVIRNDGTADELRAEAQKLVDWLKTHNHKTT